MGTEGRGFNSHPGVFLCPCVGPVPSIGLTLTWFMWDRNLALHVTLHFRQLILFKICVALPTFV